MNERLDENQRGERRLRGLDTLRRVHGRDEAGGGGDLFAMAVEHLFAELWARDVLTVRERRLLLLGLLIGQDLDDAVRLQLDAALRAGELSAEELREIVLFITHYAGWPRGAKLNGQVERIIERAGNG